jgi:HAD superfamily hydrolase (TIGR01509 family)
MLMPQGLSLSNYRAVLFDVDGTLVNSAEMFVQGLGDAFEKYAGIRPPREEILALMGVPLAKQLELYQKEKPSQEQLEEMIGYAIERYAVHEHHETLFDAAVETLRLCDQCGLKTALVTSKNAEELEGFLKRFPGAEFVHTTVCASDVHHPKPAPDSAVLACQKLGVSPSEAVFIGDSVYDMRCARSAGISSVAVTYGAAQRHALEAENPDLLIDTPEQLLEWAQCAFLETSCRERRS